MCKACYRYCRCGKVQIGNEWVSRDSLVPSELSVNAQRRLQFSLTYLAVYPLQCDTCKSDEHVTVVRKDHEVFASIGA